MWLWGVIHGLAIRAYSYAYEFVQFQALQGRFAFYKSNLEKRTTSTYQANEVQDSSDSKDSGSVIHNRCFLNHRTKTRDESSVSRIFLCIISPVLFVCEPYDKAMSMAVLKL